MLNKVNLMSFIIGLIIMSSIIIIPTSGYNVTTGDKIVKGTLDIDISRLTDLKEYEPVTVVGVQYNDIFNSYSIECK